MDKNMFSPIPENEMVEEIFDKKEIIINRFTYLSTLFVMGIIYSIYAAEGSINATLDLINFIAGAVGLSAVFGGISAIIGFIRFVMNKRPNKKTYKIYYWVSLFLFLFFMGGKYQIKRYEELSSVVTSNNSEYYKFSNDEYSVMFKKEPKRTILSNIIDKKTFEAPTAELVLRDEMSFCRADYINFDRDFCSKIDKEYVQNYLNKYAMFNDLEDISFSYEVNEFGKVGSLKGVKSLVDKNGDSHRITYFVKAFHGNSSCMTLYVGCPPEYYPTTVISEFLNSVRKNGK